VLKFHSKPDGICNPVRNVFDGSDLTMAARGVILAFGSAKISFWHSEEWLGFANPSQATDNVCGIKLDTP